MNKEAIIIDDAVADQVAVELSREIANAIESAIALAEQGKPGEAQAVINKLCSNVRYKPMVGVKENGNVKLTEHPVIQHYANEIANASRFGEANFSIPLNGRGPWTPAMKGKLDINDMIREVHGLRIIIENAKGSLRCGYTKDGKRWETRMPADYGYVSAVDVVANSLHPHAGRPGQVGGSAPNKDTIDWAELDLRVKEELKKNPLPASSPVDEAIERIDRKDTDGQGLIDNPFSKGISEDEEKIADGISNEEILAHGRLEQLDPRSLRATQTGLKKAKLIGMVKSGDIKHSDKDPILAVRIGNKTILQDGNHRAAAAMFLDQQKVTVKVLSVASANSFVPAKPGSDGDGVDCWLGEVPSDQVHIIDQRDLDTKKFDEHKCFVDFASRQDALATYLRAYHDGKAHQRIMGIRTMNIPQFKAWLQTAQTKKRASRKNLVIANADTGQRRAKAGGEFGPNGEWYEGGKWIATTEDRAKQAPVVHEVSPEEKARRAAQQAKDNETAAHIQRWSEARKAQNKHVVDTLNFHPKDMWGNPIAEYIPNQFHLSLASQLEREGSLSPRQAEFAVKAVLGRQTKKNAEQWQSLHEQLTEDFKPGHPTFEQTKPVANATDDLHSQKAKHDRVRDVVEDIYREELNDAVVAGSVGFFQGLINEYESGKDTDGLIVLLNDSLRVAGERAFKTSAQALGWPLRGRELDSQAKSFAEKRLEDLKNAVSKVSSTVSASIQRGVAAGESPKALGNRIREGFRLAKPELDLIAETETQIVYGQTQATALALAGFGRKRWITMADERVRHSHTMCEEQGAIPVDVAFHNGLSYPGDPNGDISEVINCRCYLIGER